jgi:hypothetical protein
MGKKKTTSRRRRSAKIGLLTVGTAFAAASVLGLQATKNPATERIRTAASQLTGISTQDPILALLLVFGTAVLRKEANKAGLNPGMGPFKAI